MIYTISFMLLLVFVLLYLFCCVLSFFCCRKKKKYQVHSTSTTTMTMGYSNRDLHVKTLNFFNETSAVSSPCDK